MPKPTLEFFSVSKIPKEMLEPTGKNAGTLTRVLSTDPDTGNATQILYHPPGAQWGETNGVMHDYWEEVLILRGRIKDRTLNQWFEAQSYCCQPPGMKHGPFEADGEEGCDEIVWIRYPKDEQEAKPSSG